MPPQKQVEHFCDQEKKLTWVRAFLKAHGTADVLLVGGTVRDILLGKHPADIDLVITNTELDDVVKWLRKNGKAEEVETRFGTIKFTPKNQKGIQPIDIALPRVESIGEHHYSGKNDLHVQFDAFLPIDQDLARRDFTVNAIAYSYKHNNIIDPFDGIDDLHGGIIRTVGLAKERFHEDATRILRGLRFASRLQFSIEEHTWNAMQSQIETLNSTRMEENGTHKYVIARELIGREFLLAFTAHPVHTLMLWNHVGALELFLPEVHKTQSVIEQNGKTAFEKTINLLHLLQKKSFLRIHKTHTTSATTLLAALFCFTEQPLKHRAFEVCQNLFLHQFSKSHPSHVNCSDVLWLVEKIHHFEEQDPSTMRPSEFESLFCNERGQQLLILMNAVYAASESHSPARARLHTARRIHESMMKTICPQGENLKHLLSGEDLKKLNIPEGPQYREIKSLTRDAQLTGRIKSKKDALTFVKTHFLK